MRKLFASVAIAALIAGPAFAQDITNSPGSAASGSNSAANSGSTSAANNGGVFAPVSVGPIDASSRTTSNSDSSSTSGSISSSTSQGGSAGATSNAVTGPSTATASTGASTSGAEQNQSADNAGNAQSITFNTTNPDKLKTNPAVYAPAMTTTLTETCMGSTSGGVSVLGFGGTLGTTWNDDQCVRRLNARELAVTIGDRQAALALLCQDKDVQAAYSALGRSCLAPIPVAVVSAPIPVPTSTPPPVEPSKPPVTMEPIPNPAKGDDGERG